MKNQVACSDRTRVMLVMVFSAVLGWVPSHAYVLLDPNDEETTTALAYPSTYPGNEIPVFLNGKWISGPDPNTVTVAWADAIDWDWTVDTCDAAASIDGVLSPWVELSESPNVTNKFQSLHPAPAGKAWHGFLGLLPPGIPDGTPVKIRIHISKGAPASKSEIEQALLHGLVGSASSDPTGQYFDPVSVSFAEILAVVFAIPPGVFAIPALSGEGLILLAALLVLAGVGVMARRRWSSG